MSRSIVTHFGTVWGSGCGKNHNPPTVVSLENIRWFNDNKYQAIYHTMANYGILCHTKEIRNFTHLCRIFLEILKKNMRKYMWFKCHHRCRLDAHMTPTITYTHMTHTHRHARPWIPFVFDSVKGEIRQKVKCQNKLSVWKWNHHCMSSCNILVTQNVSIGRFLPSDVDNPSDGS